MMWKTKTTEIGRLRGVEEEIEVGCGSPQLLPDSDYLLSGEPRFEMEDRGQQDSRSHYWLTHFTITLCASNQLSDIAGIPSKGSIQLEIRGSRNIFKIRPNQSWSVNVEPSRHRLE